MAVKQKKMSLREFAARISVPAGTVSKALHPGTRYRISPGKVTLIREKAEELGFSISTEKAPDSRRLPRLGLICGAMLQYLGSHFYNGVQEVCRRRDVSLLLESCNHDPDQEKAAFRRMCSENVDALIYWPAAKPVKDFRRKSLTKVECSVPEEIPFVCIGGNFPASHAYRILYRTAEAGKKAALRQLAAGCRNFIVMRFNLTWLDDREAENAYRRTLLDSGIPARKIHILQTGSFDSPEKFACFRNAEGVWLNHLFLLHMYMPYIRSHVDLKRLHVDGIGYLEFFRSVRRLCSPLYSMLDMGEFFSDNYGSSGVVFCSLRELGARSAEKALELIDIPKESRPGREYCGWHTEEDEKKLEFSRIKVWK